MTASSGPVRDEAWLRRERGRIGRDLHPDRGGAVKDYLEALAELERVALGAVAPGNRSATIEVRTTMSGRVRRGRRKVAAATTVVGRGASQSLVMGRRLIGRPARPPRVL